MAKRVVKKKGANGYKMPDPLPKGEILTDIAKKGWKLGDSIGQGGFGEIYSAQETDTKGTTYPYVIKIEPHENGPLFVEINFYIRNAKSQDVEEFKSKKKLKTLGMPVYLGSGSHEHKNEKYRFLVMQKFGTDIWKLFLEEKTFPIATVFKLGIQILDVLEYIHERGYVHADIKGANILLGVGKEAKEQVYLVDFGLATKYQTEGVFKPNPKKAHDGTIEYLSRDAHQGVPTRRGDLEILAYNMIQWLGCTLPWDKITNPTTVQEMKEKQMSNVKTFLNDCFKSNAPVALTQFLNYINELTFDAKPNYEKIRKLFMNELEKAGAKITSPFSFKIAKTPTKRKIESKKTAAKKIKKDVEPKEEEPKKVARSRRVNSKVEEKDDEESKSKEDESKKTGTKRGAVKKTKDAEPKEDEDETKKVASKKSKKEVDKVENMQDEEENETKKVTRSRRVQTKVEYKEESESEKDPKKTGTKRGAVKKLKKIEPKEEAEEVEPKEKQDEFEGYTAEMKALALKKAENGVKKRKPRKKTEESET